MSEEVEAVGRARVYLLVTGDAFVVEGCAALLAEVSQPYLSRW